MKNLPGTIWPSEEQRLLFTAALGEPAPAAAAWQAMRPDGSIEELEDGSFPLLPLVYRNLSLAGHDDFDLQRLKGIYRRAWVRNNLLVERTESISKALDEKRFRVEFVEGVTLASRFYDELALRPTSLVDILVAREDRRSALAALARIGWGERRDLAPGGDDASYLFDEQGNACVVQTSLAPDLMSNPASGPETFLWEPGDRHPVGDVAIPVPPPTETLFAVCVGHARVEGVRNLQWIADAKMVLQVDVDWQRIVALARASGQISRLHDALVCLRDLAGPKPPQEVCNELAATAEGRRQRISYLCSVGAIWGPGALPALVGEHIAGTADRSFLGVVAAFPGFLRRRWNLARTWHVPFAAGKRALRLLGDAGRAT